MSCCKQVFMPVRGGTHYLFFSFSLSVITSLSFCVSLYLSLSLALSLLSIPSLLNNNNINNSRAEMSLGRQNDSQWDEASGVNTTIGDSFIETPPSPSPSHSVCLLPPPAGKHTLEIRDFKYISVCVSMYVHPFLVNFNFVGVFEDSAGFIQDALAQRGSWHCVWHHTPVAVFDVFTPLLRERGPSPQMQTQDRRKRTGSVRKREEVLEKYDWYSLSGLGLTLPYSQVCSEVCATFHTVAYARVCVCMCMRVGMHVCIATFTVWTTFILARKRWEGNVTERGKGKWVSWGGGVKRSNQEEREWEWRKGESDYFIIKPSLTWAAAATT